MSDLANMNSNLLQIALKNKKILIIVGVVAVSYTHLRAHETVLDLVCRLLLEKKKYKKKKNKLSKKKIKKQYTHTITRYITVTDLTNI